MERVIIKGQVCNLNNCPDPLFVLLFLLVLFFSFIHVQRLLADRDLLPGPISAGDPRLPVPCPVANQEGIVKYFCIQKGYPLFKGRNLIDTRGLESDPPAEAVYSNDK